MHHLTEDRIRTYLEEASHRPGAPPATLRQIIAALNEDPLDVQFALYRLEAAGHVEQVWWEDSPGGIERLAWQVAGRGVLRAAA